MIQIYAKYENWWREIYIYIGVLISTSHDQEGSKLIFLSEWHEFPSAP